MTTRPGIYADKQGNTLAVCGTLGRKCLMTYPTYLTGARIPVWIVSTRRFRETMSLKTPFTVDDVAGYQDRIVAHGPRRLCNKLERHVLFGEEGRAICAAIFADARGMAVPVPASSTIGTGTGAVVVATRAPVWAWIKVAVGKVVAFGRWLFGSQAVVPEPVANT